MTMIAAGFFPARFSTHVPSVKGYKQAANPTYLKGYPVVATAGLINECGANPLEILGVALQDYSTAPGYNAANNPAPITGQYTGGSVALAVNTTEFVGRLVNNSNITVAPADADVQAQYGISKQSGGWAVDKSLVGADARVVITGIDTLNNLVYFKFLAAYVQAA